MLKSRKRFWNILLVMSCAAIFLSAFFRVHMRVQTTLLAYELGKLKNSENLLLEERSRLNVELAKITTKEHLELMANSTDEDGQVRSLVSN